MTTYLNGVLVSLAGIICLTAVTIFSDVNPEITVPAIAALAGYAGGYVHTEALTRNNVAPFDHKDGG
jgi:hypothetical protein